MTKPLISVVSPVYNEALVVVELMERLGKVADELRDRFEFEFILVDDGSRDDSVAVIKSILGRESRLRLLELRRNYGQTSALQAGLDAARGDFVVTLDSDLQHLPEEIPQFLAKLEEGYDMVCGWRRNRVEGLIRRWPSQAANWLLRVITALPFHDFGTTFRAYRRDSIKDLRLYGEFHRFIPALAHDLGARITEIPITNVLRRTGRSNYGIGRTVGVFLDLIVLLFFIRYLDRPMRAFGKLGLLCAFIGITIIIFLMVMAHIFDVAMFKERPGWLLLGVMLILTSVQLFVAGILGEILIRIHYGQGDRRVYRIRGSWNSQSK